MPTTQRNLYMVRDVLTGQFYARGSRLRLVSFGRAPIWSNTAAANRVRNKIIRYAGLANNEHYNSNQYWQARIEFALERMEMENNGVELVHYTIEAETAEAVEG
jgi:hypothetical protein